MSQREAVSTRQVGNVWWVLLGGSLLAIAETRDAADQAVGCMTLMLKAGLDTAMGIPGVRAATPNDVRGKR